MGFIALLMLNTILIGSGAIGSTAFLIGLGIVFLLLIIGVSLLP